MERSFGDRLKHAWNAFRGVNEEAYVVPSGAAYSMRPDRPRLTRGNERSIITSIFNRIALDTSQIELRHVLTDKNGRFLEVIDSGINNCLTLEANLDQTARSFIQDVVLSMLDEGCIAMVPVDTTLNPKVTGSYDIVTMRRGKIVTWYPENVRLSVYNEKTGRSEEVILPKKIVAIIENPFYSVVNEPNSTFKRLSRKLSLLDAVDEQTSSGKLDLIIQLPYVVKSQTRKEQAEQRRREIEQQLTGSKYGIAYTDGTEHVIQLNRAAENTLMSQIEYLTRMLYSQLGITPEIMDGTATETAMMNYYSRTIEPIVVAIASELTRKFITSNARSRGQKILFFRDPFKLVPVSSIAEIADKFTRNEIMTSNEVRQAIGLKPVNDPKADELRNANLNHPDEKIEAEKKAKQEENEDA